MEKSVSGNSSVSFILPCICFCYTTVLGVLAFLSKSSEGSLRRTEDVPIPRILTVKAFGLRAPSLLASC